MVKKASSTDLNIGHPAPQRRQAHPVLLICALVAGPIGWMVQLVFAFAATSYLCVAADSGVPPGWLLPLLIALNLCGLALAVAGLSIATLIFSRTAHEHRGRSGGVLDAGEGRTRFLAIWGIFISLVFLVATLANSFSLFLVPLCKS